MSLLDIAHVRSVFKEFLDSRDKPLSQAELSHKIDLLEQFREDLKTQRLQFNRENTEAFLQYYQHLGEIQSHIDYLLAELKSEYDFSGFLSIEINGLTPSDTLFLNNIKAMLLAHQINGASQKRRPLFIKDKVFIFCGALEKINLLNSSPSLKQEISFLKTRFLTPQERTVSYEKVVEAFLSTMDVTDEVESSIEISQKRVDLDVPVPSPAPEELFRVRQRFFRN